MSCSKKYTLKSGDKLPAIGVGCWKSSTSEVKDAIINAISVGYRLIDSAAAYGNEKQIGEAISEALSRGLLKSRSELWVTSKLWQTEHHGRDVEAACRRTIADLHCDYLDLYLVHAPICLDKHSGAVIDVPIEETWAAMEELVAKGLVRNIGVSNWTVKKLEHLLSFCKIQPAVNQVEMTPLLQQKPLRQYCSAHGIHVTAYSSLGSNDSQFRGTFPNLITHPTIVHISEKHPVTPAQVLLGWAINEGVSVIPKSVRKERLIENLQSEKVTLDEDDLRQIAEMDAHKRSCDLMLFFKNVPGMTLEKFWDNE